ncbi:hypothetical protein E2C01_049772 [Portunus trituberculatus]|uniref:Uncharacterized protein n=1 Tax=Portunus trituberculatus TaxID=210409 RepID=A0A5B7GEQ1_PORTR|nr:hypothetical protein [Portunus trituberculatus]
MFRLPSESSYMSEGFRSPKKTFPSVTVYAIGSPRRCTIHVNASQHNTRRTRHSCRLKIHPDTHIDSPSSRLLLQHAWPTNTCAPRCSKV